MNTSTDQLAAIAAVFAVLFAAHSVGDHWVQTGHQAEHKGLPGWPGRWACAAHVATYTVTGVVALAMLAAVTGWRPAVVPLLAGLGINAGTHYIADRRTPLQWIAERLGSGRFWQLGDPSQCLGTGRYALDQSWHHGWILVTALIIGGASWLPSRPGSPTTVT
jgi:hypothetical protein